MHARRDALSRALRSLLLLLLLAPFAVCDATVVVLNVSDVGAVYDGIGALSGGGGVTRLLIDYAPALQSDILDALFLPKAGASLQIIKVEIGGDTQSTEGTELSHMHTPDDLNCSRGYEWLILREARRRNPDILTYGLCWGVPAWVGAYENEFYTEQNIQYHLSWLQCAAEQDTEIDYLGVFNERGADPNWTTQLRSAMDAAGFANTRIVAADTDWSTPTNNMLADAAFKAAVDVLGAHYPGPPPAASYTLNKTLWASEMWNLGKVNDWAGAQQLMADLVSQASWGLSASIVWCLIFSWPAILPFSTVIPGTVAGAGHALLTAAEPWSGHWFLTPQIAALAHHTQFAEPGWRHLAQGAPGMSALPGGGALVTRMNPYAAPGAALDFSVTAHTAGASAAQTLTLQLAGLGAHALPAALHVWFTNASASFVQLADVPDGGGGAYTLTLLPDAFYSLTTTTGQAAPAPRTPIPASAHFPFPYADDFESYLDGAYARYFCDEGGAFVVAPIPRELSRRAAAAAGGEGHALFQLVTDVPLAWEKNPSPYTLIGDFNADGSWTDYALSVDVAIAPGAAPAPAAAVMAADMAPCSGAASQAWRIVSGASTLDAPSALESSAQPGMCLGTTGATLYPGALDAGLQPCNASSLPLWQFVAGTGQLLMTRAGAAAGSCLDVLSANASSGARVDVYECKNDGSSNQVWAVGYPAAGRVTLASALATPHLCLDIEALAPPPPAIPFVAISARIAVYVRNGPPPSGYTLNVFLSANATTPADWTLEFGGAVLAAGVTPAPVLAGVFYTATVTAKGSAITASWAGATLASITDSKSSHGMAAVGSGWHNAFFDNFAVAAV